MKDVLKRIVQPLMSRKVRTALTTVIVAYLAKSGLDVSDDVVYGIVGVGVAIILGVAIEDNGAKRENNGK